MIMMAKGSIEHIVRVLQLNFVLSKVKVVKELTLIQETNRDEMLGQTAVYKVYKWWKHFKDGNM